MTRQRSAAGMMMAMLVATTAILAEAGASPANAQEAAEIFAPADEVVLRGDIQVIWGDPPPGSGLPSHHRYELITETGECWRLDLSPDLVASAGGLLALNRSRATVAGVVARAGVPKLRVTRILRDDSDLGPSREVLGSLPYVWILLRFADNPSTPQPPSFFEEQALGGYPSLDHYFREVSYNNINLAGSTVLGWFDLPHPRSYYVYEFDPDHEGEEVDGERTLADATALADPSVDFTKYAGFHMCFNDVLDCCSYGGQAMLTLDGETRYWNVTWLADWGWGNHDVIAHETGHSIGWPHSSGPYGEIYDSRWDIMSAKCGTCTHSHPVYGNLGVNTIAYHKDLAGWIHPLHRFVVPAEPFVGSLWLNNLADPPPPGRYLVAKVFRPGDWLRHYTVERRQFWGYDQALPAETVIIHAVDPFRDEPAHVMDPDGNGDPNDEGARWDVGETFWDATNAILVTVEHADATGSIVTLSNAGTTEAYVDASNAGSEDGSPAHPWNTFREGYGCLYPTGTVHIQPGHYTAPFILRKAATLRRWGSSGMAILDGPMVLRGADSGTVHR